MAFAAPEIIGRRPERSKDDAILFVHDHALPCVNTAGRFPSVSRPGLISRLTGPRNHVESPEQCASAHIEPAYVTGHRRRYFGNPAVYNEHVAID